MRAALADIRDLTAGDKQTFVGDRRARQAVAYNLAVLGEAARAPSARLRDQHPEIPWRDVIAQRNVVIQEYQRLDIDSLWTTATEDIPRLDDQLAAIEVVQQD